MMCLIPRGPVFHGTGNPVTRIGCVIHSHFSNASSQELRVHFYRMGSQERLPDPHVRHPSTGCSYSKFESKQPMPGCAQADAGIACEPHSFRT